MSSFITALVNKEQPLHKEPLVECECGCGRLYPASQMKTHRVPGTRRVEKIYSLHFYQIWGNFYGDLPRK